MQLYSAITAPSPPGDKYPRYDDCLEDKREDYQNCSVLYCVPQLYSVICTLIWAVLTGELGPVGLGLVSFSVCFCVFWTRDSLSYGSVSWCLVQISVSLNSASLTVYFVTYISHVFTCIMLHLNRIDWSLQSANSPPSNIRSKVKVTKYKNIFKGTEWLVLVMITFITSCTLSSAQLLVWYRSKK